MLACTNTDLAQRCLLLVGVVLFMHLKRPKEDSLPEVVALGSVAGPGGPGGLGHSEDLVPRLPVRERWPEPKPEPLVTGACPTTAISPHFWWPQFYCVGDRVIRCTLKILLVHRAYVKNL